MSGWYPWTLGVSVFLLGLSVSLFFFFSSVERGTEVTEEGRGVEGGVFWDPPTPSSPFCLDSDVL